MSDDIDIGQISEALNDKMDRDVGNPETLGKERMAEFAMPSNTYEELTLGTNGSYYIAPANGYFAINGQANNTNAETTLDNRGTDGNENMATACYPTHTNQYLNVFVPVKKGDRVYCFYAYITLVYFRFIYAKGEENV